MHCQYWFAGLTLFVQTLPLCQQTLSLFCVCGFFSILLPVELWLCRSTGEYAVSFEVWHEKLLENAEAYYEMKLASDSD